MAQLALGHSIVCCKTQVPVVKFNNTGISMLPFTTAACAIAAPCRVADAPPPPPPAPEGKRLLDSRPIHRVLTVGVDTGEGDVYDDQPWDLGMLSGVRGWFATIIQVQRVDPDSLGPCEVRIPGTTYIIRDAFPGVWHFFHNILVRTFGTLSAGVSPPLLVCHADNPKACTVDPSVRIINQGDDLNNNGVFPRQFAGYLDALSTHPLISSLDPGTCFDSVIWGAPSAIDLNFGFLSPRIVLFLAHFQRWYVHTATVLAALPEDQASLVAAPLLPLLYGPSDGSIPTDGIGEEYIRPIPKSPRVLFITRVGSSRPTALDFVANATAWLGARGIPSSAIDEVSFGKLPAHEIPPVFANATIVVSFSGAQLTNLHSLLPGTVLIDSIVARYFGGTSGSRTTHDFYNLWANARNCPVVRFLDPAPYPPGTTNHMWTPQSIPEHVFHTLLSKALELGVHAYMPPSWTPAPPLPPSLPHPEYGVFLPPDDLSSYLTGAGLQYASYP